MTKLIAGYTLSLCLLVFPVELVAGPSSYSADGRPRRWQSKAVSISWQSHNQQLLSDATLGRYVTQALTQWTSLPTVDLGMRLVPPPAPAVPETKGAMLAMLVGPNIPDITVLVYPNRSTFRSLLTDLGQASESPEGDEMVGFSWEPTASPNNPPAFRQKTIVAITAVPGQDPDRLMRILIHEIGHALGHDNTPLQLTEARNLDRDPAYHLPVMSQYTKSRVLQEDDVSSMSLLYPNASSRQWYGRVIGTVRDAVTGDRLPGVIVRATEILTSSNHVREITALTTSEVQVKEFGSFELALPYGSYSLAFESAPATYNKVRQEDYLLGPDNRTQIYLEKGIVVHVGPGTTLSVGGHVSVVPPQDQDD